MNCSRLAATVLAAMVVVLCGVKPLWAAIDADWKTSADGIFEVGGNWSTDPTAPVAFDDTANFNTSAVTAYTVTFNGDVTNAGLYVKDDTLTFDLTGGRTYTVTDKFELGDGAGETGVLTVKNGTLTSTVPYVSGKGSQIGNYGNGTLNVESGGTFTTTSTYTWVGYGSGTTGTVNVSGNGSSASFANIAGGRGTTNINVTAGANFSCGNLYTAYYAGSGTVVIDGTSTTAALNGNVNIGTKGTSSMKIRNGAVVTTLGGLYLGGSTGSHGTVEIGVEGTGTISPDNGAITVGHSSGTAGEGTLHIGPGGTITKTGGYDRVYKGTVTIDAGGSWYACSFDVHANGSVTVNGTLTSYGYDLNVEGTLQGSGTVNLGGSYQLYVENGGTIGPGSSIGTLTLTGGQAADTLDCTGGTLELEFDAASCDLIQLIDAVRSIDLDGATLDFEGSGLTGNESGQYDFLTADTITGFATVTANDIDSVMTGLGFAPANYSLDVVGDAGSGQALRLTYVPEPATMAMLCAGGVLMLLRRKQ